MIRIKSQRAIILCLLIGVVASAQDFDQLLKQKQYNAVIRPLINKPELSDLDAFLLIRALKSRAELFRDLLAVQARIGCAYHQQRDTSRVAARDPYNGYFLGRYWLEMGDFKTGKRVLQKYITLQTTTEEFRQRAAIWLGVAEFKLGNVLEAGKAWQKIVSQKPGLVYELALASWICKKTATSETGLPADAPWSFWSPARPVAGPAAAANKEAWISASHPSIIYSVRGEYDLKFYDPSVLLVLAQSDYNAALDILAKIKIRMPELEHSAGMLCYEAADLSAAKRHFTTAGNARPETAWYLAAVEWELGNQEPLSHLWLTIDQINHVPLLLTIFDICSRYKEFTDKVWAQYLKTTDRFKGSDTEKTLALSRCLQRMGKSEQALQLLLQKYPVVQSELKILTPSYLAVLSDVQFSLGRNYHDEVTNHLADLKERFPIVSGLYDMIQAYRTPENPNSGKERPGLR